MPPSVLRHVASLAAALTAAAPTLGQEAEEAPVMQTVVLMSMVVERGPGCGTVKPWEAELLRSEAELLYERFEPEERPGFEARAAAWADAASCDEPALTAWPASQREAWEEERLPRFLIAYRALALLADPPSAFAAETGREDYGLAIRAIDARFGALEAGGVRAPGGGGWAQYLDRMERAVAARAARTDEASTDEASDRYFAEVARITELWLDEALPADG